MKKLLTIILTICVLFPLTACTSKEKPKEDHPQQEVESPKKTMVIKPSELSQETKDILKVLEKDCLAFYDLDVDKTAKSYTINVWVNNGDKWEEKGMVRDNIYKDHYRIGLSIDDEDCDIIFLEDGYKKVSYTYKELEFDKNMGVMTHQAADSIDIELNKEITLWLKVGSNATQMSTPGNFRETQCDQGFAITITISDQVIE